MDLGESIQLGQGRVEDLIDLYSIPTAHIDRTFSEMAGATLYGFEMDDSVLGERPRGRRVRGTEEGNQWDTQSGSKMHCTRVVGND